MKKLLVLILLTIVLANAQINWTRAADTTGWHRRMHAASVVFDGKLWLLGGKDNNNDYNDVWFTTDGTNWTRATQSAFWHARWGHGATIYDGKMWIFGGAYSQPTLQLLRDVWFSTDGITWTLANTEAPWTGRGHPEVVVFDNKMWLIGGWLRPDTQLYANDVWYSNDGVQWYEVTSAAQWTPRTGHRANVYDNKMWVMGGYSDRSNNDVWFSTDGETWIQATSYANWNARQYHSGLVFQNRLWVVGGLATGGNYYQDAWYSSDGITWTAAGNPAPWSGRGNHTSAVYDNKLWIMGGYNGTVLQDVWYTTGLSGIEEYSMPDSKDLITNPTIVRDVLYLPSSGAKHQALSMLYNITGRKVMNLEPGINNIGHLTPGVYFIKDLAKNKTNKIVIQR